MSGNNISSPFGTLNLVNLGKILAANPDEERTHIVIDYVLAPRTNEGGRPGFMHCEVYRGPPMADIIAHLDSDQIYNALGGTFDTMRTAFQYRRDGVVGLIGAYEEGSRLLRTASKGACGSASRWSATTIPRRSS